MPFIAKGERNDVAVTIYALNIYPENINAGLASRGVAPLVSGQFFAFHKNVAHYQKEKLCIKVELAQGIRPTQKISERVRRAITDNLIKLNIEYRKLYGTVGPSVLPELKLVPFGVPYSHAGQGGIVLTKGKKARMVQ